MIDYMKSILTAQFEAALCMLDHCIRECPPEHWEGKVANRSFRWVAYHTLFWVDVYLSPGDEEADDCDFFVTWNCKHLANANKFDNIAKINGILGLKVPKLVTPLELLSEVPENE